MGLRRFLVPPQGRCRFHAIPNCPDQKNIPLAELKDTCDDPLINQIVYSYIPSSWHQEKTTDPVISLSNPSRKKNKTHKKPTPKRKFTLNETFEVSKKSHSTKNHKKKRPKPQWPPQDLFSWADRDAPQSWSNHVLQSIQPTDTLRPWGSVKGGPNGSVSWLLVY